MWPRCSEACKCLRSRFLFEFNWLYQYSSEFNLPPGGRSIDTSPQINWALVGLGDIACKRVGPALLSQAESNLYACVTRNPDGRQDKLASLKPTRVYTEFERVLSDPEVDAVYLATPVCLHASHAISALQAGKHVVVEKPMALNSRDAEKILSAAKQSEGSLAVAYYRRFWPTFERVKSMIECGELGQVVLVRLAMHSWYNPVSSDPKAWRVDPEKSGGGVLSDAGSHRLDILAWWFGLPRKIVSDVGTTIHDYSAEDSATALLTFDDNVPCTVSFQWNSKTWTDEIHIVGTEAKITLHPFDGESILVTRGRETMTLTLPPPANAHLPMIDEFAKSIIQRRSPRFCGEDGFAATQIIDGIYESSRTSTWVKL